MSRGKRSGESFWRGRGAALLRPSPDARELERALGEARLRQPPPVLWLLGKTQSGKTSIIRALTDDPRAQTGTGFRPCTRTASLYDFPPEAPLVRFLDTRGLGEVGYDPQQDIEYCESRAHLLIAVARVTDPAQAVLREVLESVRGRHPDWPVVVVQTCLHEAYAPGTEHVVPYPFDHLPWPPTVADDLRRALLSQRAVFADLPGSGPVLQVAVDLTLPEDGQEPADYGLEALWSAMDEAAALGLKALLCADPAVNDVYARAAHPHIVGYSVAAATLGALPVVDLALVPGLQLKLLHTLAALYGRRWTSRATAEFLGMLGVGFIAGYGLRMAGRALAKLIPVAGQTVGAVWGASGSAVVTFALGKAACHYLARTGKGLEVERGELRQVFARALVQGRGLVARRGPQETS